MEHSSRQTHILGPKTTLTHSKGLISSKDPLYHRGITQETSERKLSGQFQNVWRLNTTLLTNPWVKEFSREIFKYFALADNEKTTN